MFVIVKIKVVYSGLMKSQTYAHSPEIKWIHKTKEEALDGVNDASIDRNGYKVMRRGREKDQYLFDTNFKGNKDIVYSAIEKELKPLIRERLLTELLEN